RCSLARDCEAIRIRVDQFEMSRNKRRVFNRGERLIVTKVGLPEVDSDRVGLFNRHRNERGMNNDGADASLSGYRSFLVDSCCETIELSYWLDDRLAGIAICDLGDKSMSAVYSFFDPDVGRLSLGVYSVLKQIEFCRTHNFDLLYLGFYVAGSPHMRYKAEYKPHERLIAGDWVEFV
ncbi:MAG: arginyltransferase, partial [bacterium]|nr:arginyltransferase [bacterium]